LKLLFVFSFLVATSAQAGILLEPYAGYFSESFSGKVKNTNTTQDLKTTGLGIGARAGYVLPVIPLWFALDYFMHPETSTNYSDTSTNTPADLKSSRSTLFIDVGTELPMLPLRFWLGYAIMDNWHTHNATNNYDTDWTGSAIKLGAGYKVIPLLSLNLEYIMHTADKFKTAGNPDRGATEVYDDPKTTTIIFSVSAPFIL
jgi:hypothetical protein